jgi:hypothetical protein
MNNHVTIRLEGGLGNQLFQLSFLMYMKSLGYSIFLDSIQSPRSYHSSVNYFETLLSKWNMYFSSKKSIFLSENRYLRWEDWKQKVNITEDVTLKGYFQRHEYTDPVREEFINSLTFDESVLQKYDISSKFFIHVRGGDYIVKPLHFIDLKQYYLNCMANHPGEEFIIFTNDIPYATRLFPNIPIIQESEVDTLLLMSRAKGCICANSSFSWWGAYLNTNRQIYLPSNWTTDVSIDSSAFHFEGSTVVQV